MANGFSAPSIYSKKLGFLVSAFREFVRLTGCSELCIYLVRGVVIENKTVAVIKRQLLYV